MLCRCLLSPPSYDHIRYDVHTEEEFWFLLRRWTQKRFLHTHPILYLGFHGNPGVIFLRNGKSSPEIHLNEVRDELIGQCKGRVIVLGSCETMEATSWSPRRFCEVTPAAAICGYKRPIDWMTSAAMDLLLLSAMQRNAFTAAGIRAMSRSISRRAKGLRSHLGLRIFTKDGEIL